MRVRVTVRPSGGGGGEWAGILMLIGSVVLVVMCIGPFIHSAAFRGFVWDIVKVIGILVLMALTVCGIIGLIALIIWLIIEFFG